MERDKTPRTVHQGALGEEEGGRASEGKKGNKIKSLLTYTYLADKTCFEHTQRWPAITSDPANPLNEGGAGH